MENREPAGEQAVGALLLTIYNSFRTYYGPQSWWPTRTGSAWEIMLGAVLTQRTTWTNVELSLSKMVERWSLDSLRDPRIVLEAPDEELAAVLRPTGFFASKPKTLKNLAGYVISKDGVEALVRCPESREEMRKELLGLWGIGPETADAILLYALGRPSFVADAYALRLASRWGLVRPNAGYDKVRALFMDNLQRDTALFNEYHALIVQHGKNICRPKPLCDLCPLGNPISVDETSERRYKWRCPRLGVA